MIPPKKFKLVMSPNAYNLRQRSNAFFPSYEAFFGFGDQTLVVGEGTGKHNLLEDLHLLPSQHPHSCSVSVLVTVIPGTFTE